MSIRIRAYDEDFFIIEGDLSGKDSELRTLGANIGRNENGLLVWKAPHQLRPKFERYIEIGRLYLPWSRSKMLQIFPSSDLQFIQETLTRIGKYHIFFGDKVFYRMFHLHQENGKYYFLHHLEVLELKGIRSAMTFYDFDIRDYIANTLESWGYFQIVDPSKRVKVTNQMIKDVSLISVSEKENNFWCTVYDSF